MKYYLLTILVVVVSCTSSNQYSSGKLKIGFSRCTTGDIWRQTMNAEMMRETGFYPDYKFELIIKDADDQNSRQIQDIKDLVAEGVDILIVSPNEAEPLTPIVEEVYDSGIPVILIDRKISSEKFTAFIGGDNFDIGYKAGSYAAQLLNSKGRILEIAGLSGSTPAIERSRGFRLGLGQYPEIEIVKTTEGSWLQTKALEMTDSLFRVWKDFDLIYAHNDRLAYSASISAAKHGLNPYIIGIDGLDSKGGGVDLVLNRNINGTFLYPTGGDKAIQLAMDIIAGKSFSKINKLETIKIDFNNVQTVRYQADQIHSRQTKIDLQREQIDNITLMLSKRNTIVFLSFVITGLLIAIALMTVYFLYRKNLANRLLDQKNRTIHEKTVRITEQRDKLVRVLKIAEEATETKNRFFTNISHEFRQTLSLVIHPVNNLITTRGNEYLKEKLKIVQKNIELLTKLSEEILNFEKIEKNKYYLSFNTVNFSQFIKDLLKSFEPEIQRHGITLCTRISDHLEGYFDPSALERVISNLLSNAIKYSEAGGSIRVEVRKQHSSIIVAVSDTGMGIPEKDLPFIFDRFYRSILVKTSRWRPGNGLGLTICKELIELHHGRIKASSKFGEGAKFIFGFPQNFIEAQSHSNWEMVNSEKFLALRHPSQKSKVLVVEDNPEILTMISEVLGRFYTVVKAKNGKEGLEKALASDLDIILSDIYMPVMDGIELCQKIKADPKTFHIPVVLLTALDSEETKIKGFDTGADGYVTKPFNDVVLISQIQNLISSRKNLKISLNNFPEPNGIKPKEKKEEEFVDACIRIIHEKGSDESFKLDDLATCMNLSRSSLYRKIKQYTGLKAVDFMRKGKLHHAARLLLTTDMSISEVAYASGYNDAKYFSRCFAKEYGHMPSKFKLSDHYN